MSRENVYCEKEQLIKLYMQNDPSFVRAQKKMAKEMIINILQ